MMPPKLVLIMRHGACFEDDSLAQIGISQTEVVLGKVVDELQVPLKDMSVRICSATSKRTKDTAEVVKKWLGALVEVQPFSFIQAHSSTLEKDQESILNLVNETVEELLIIVTHSEGCDAAFFVLLSNFFDKFRIAPHLEHSGVHVFNLENNFVGYLQPSIVS